MDPQRSPQVESLSPHHDQQWRTNFWRLIAYQVSLRVGWIFKTESVVMPACLDWLGGGGWIRGLLPIFNRFGQSFPPLLASDWLAAQPRKKRVVAGTTFLMAICFLTLALIFGIVSQFPPTPALSPSPSVPSPGLPGSGVPGAGVPDPGLTYWLPFVFVALYAIFFSCFGVNQLAQNTLQGKVIPVLRRGSLMMWSSLIGVLAATASAVLLLPAWLSPQYAAFHFVFGTTGVMFLIASCLALTIKEEADDQAEPRQSSRSLLNGAAAVLLLDPGFRWFAAVAAAFGLNMVLFPHYQALAKQNLGADLRWLMPWLVAQNIGAGVFSTLAGRIADRLGNLLALRLVLGIQMLVPAIAIAISWGGAPLLPLYLIVFALLGVTPVAYRVFANFTLELVPRRHHPKYLSTLSLCLALPAMLLSLPTGYLIDRIGFTAVFATLSLILLAGLLGTLKVPEPRHRPTTPAKSPNST